MAKIITGIGIISVILGAYHLVKESIIASKLILNCEKTKELIKQAQKQEKT